MDLVVTVPKDRWLEWIEEGDAVGTPPSGETWGFYVSGKPDIQEGDRLYVVAWGRLRGYAPVTGVQRAQNQWAILRKGGAVAVTIPAEVKGFRGYQKPWWGREEEVPFESWRTAGVPVRELEKMAARFELGKQRVVLGAVRDVASIPTGGDYMDRLAAYRKRTKVLAQGACDPQFWSSYTAAFESEIDRLLQALEASPAAYRPR